MPGQTEDCGDWGPEFIDWCQSFDGYVAHLKTPLEYPSFVVCTLLVRKDSHGFYVAEGLTCKERVVLRRLAQAKHANRCFELVDYWIHKEYLRRDAAHIIRHEKWSEDGNFA